MSFLGIAKENQANKGGEFIQTGMHKKYFIGVDDFLETFLGFIPGFYTIAICCTMYLMLPLFNGAESIYRNILVPIAGLQELQLKRDSEMIKYEVLKQLPEERREAVLSEIADSFQKTAKEGPTKTDYQSMDNTIV